MKCVKCHKSIKEDSLFCSYRGAKQTVTKRKRGNGSGSAYRRGSGWEAQVYVDGKKHRKSGFRTKSEALAYIPTLAKRSATVLTLSDLFSMFSDMELKYKEKDLRRKYEVAFERISPVSKKDIRDVSFSQLQSIVGGLSNDQGKYVKTLLIALYRLAILQGLVQNNIAEELKVTPANPKVREPFNMSEVHKMWDAWENGDEFIGFGLIMIYSGMMPGELLNVTKNMVDFETQTITGAGMKTKKRRETPVVFAECAAPVLKKLMEGPDLCICPYTKHEFYNRWKKEMAALEVRPLNPYSCRHTTATALADLNVNPQRVKEVMRHAKMETTQRYIHTDTSFAREGIDEFKMA